ncbi:hypothetical protein RvY_19240-1 [Ramazzottius varieornatus]|uniref:TLC domain-containing protein n=1 Tax=Ramazzottius varieornatus TaxID=947166 RepID=A0A1D1W9X1_RAMVA|nr:hypothetical protein RvY_19240-1 [Ramazzottius varieornatus]
MHPASLLQSLDFSHFETDPSPSSTSRLVPPFTLPGYLQTMTLSCIAFTSLFLTLYYLLSRFTPFRRLDHGKSVARNLAGFLVSGIQAVTATIAGLIIITQTNSDILLAQSSWANWYSAVFVGYLLYDLSLILLTDLRAKKSLFASIRSHLAVYIHHLAFTIVAPITLSVRNHRADYIIGCFLLMEVPVIFLHTQNVLAGLGRSATRLYVYNGLLTIGSYFVFRLAIFPYMFHRLAQRKGTTLLHVHKTLYTSCILGTIACISIQVYWFLMICRKAYRYTKTQSLQKTVLVEDAKVQEAFIPKKME